MARYNEILVGHFARYLQKFTGIKGAVPTPTLAPEIFPMVPIFAGAENRYLGGWNIYGNFQDIAGAVGTSNGVQLLNPAGSNVIGVIQRIYFSAAGVTTIFFSNARGNPPASVLNTSTPAPSFDARITLFNATCNVQGQNTPTVPNLNSPFGKVNVTVANQDYDFITNSLQEIPLLPGDAVRLVNSTNNQELKVGFVWRERFLEESERT